MTRLTAVICFLDERDEVLRTVSSIRETAGANVEILLINDGSQPDYDYEAVARKYGCRYVAQKRAGPAVARSRGVDLATTPFVLLLDAHMRFYAEDWWRRIEDAIDDDPRALYCTQCPPLDPGGGRREAPIGLGAWVNLEPNDQAKNPVERGWSLLSTAWNNDRRGAESVLAVPSVLGGAYAFERAFFQEIGGHLGQRMYGGEEPNIGIKAWRAGGSCKVLLDVEIGHVYRTPGAPPPFTPSGVYGAYNKLVLVATVVPEESFATYRRHLRDVPCYEEALEVFAQHERLLRGLREHLHANVFRRPFSFFEELNEDFRDGLDISNRLGPA